MDVRNCKKCGRLYNYIGGSYKNLCPQCILEIEDKFTEVKQYVEKNSAASMQMISEDCDVEIQQITKWIREERLSFTEDSPIGIECENCGKMIKSGKYCDECKLSMANKLNSAYAKKDKNVIQESKESKSKMRYF